MDVYVDGVPAGEHAIVGQSSQFNAYIVVKGVAAGEHTIRLEAKGPATWTEDAGTKCPPDTAYCTLTADTFFYNVTVLELPA